MRLVIQFSLTVVALVRDQHRVCVCVYTESLQSLKKQLAAMASELLEHWAKLKEVFRIPKKVSVSV